MRKRSSSSSSSLNAKYVFTESLEKLIYSKDKSIIPYLMPWDHVFPKSDLFGFCGENAMLAPFITSLSSGPWQCLKHINTFINVIPMMTDNLRSIFPPNNFLQILWKLKSFQNICFRTVNDGLWSCSDVLSYLFPQQLKKYMTYRWKCQQCEVCPRP